MRMVGRGVAGLVWLRQGLTVAYLLFGLSIATLPLMLALPAWGTWLAEQRVRAVESRLLAALAAARAAAVGSGVAARLCAMATGGGCVSKRDWSQGWLGQSGGAQGWRSILESGALGGGVRVEVNATMLEPGVAVDTRGFALQTAGGGGFASGSLLVCATGARSRTVTLAPSGRARISTGATCS
jgi:Tfp pilus assembly protein FimT